MRNLLFFCIAIVAQLLCIHSNAQDKTSDSLQNLLRKTREDTTRLNLYLKLAAVPGQEMDRALLYFDSAIAVGQNIPDKNFLARACKSKGDKYLVVNYDSALVYYKRVVDIYTLTGNDKDLATAYYSLGNCYNSSDMLTEAMDAFVSGQRLAEKTDNTRALAYNMNGVASINFQMTNYAEAEKYHRNALEVSFEVGDPRLTAWIYTGLGQLYLTRLNYDSALVAFQGALDNYTQSQYLPGMAGAHNNIGIAYMYMKKYPEAIEHYRTAAAAKHEFNDVNGESIAVSNIAQMYALMGNGDSAIYYGLLAVELSLHGGSVLQQASSFNSLAEAYASNNQYDSAFKYQKLFKQYNDSVYNQNLHDQLAEMQAQYESEQQKQQIALLEKNNEIGQLYNYAFAISGGLVAVVAVFMFIGYRSKRRANVLLEAQNDQITQQKKEITDSINYAKKIQQALLAADAQIGRHVRDHFVLYKPKDIVSGDFYWASETVNAGNSEFWFAVCDSTGHGVPGAFMSLLNSTFLSEAVNEKKIALPGEVFDYTRRKLIDHLSHGNDAESSRSDGMDGFLLKISGNKLQYASAHGSGVLIRNGVVTELQTDKMPVGRSPLEAKPFTTNEMTIEKGDRIYLFTDGYADQFGGEKGKKFKYRNLVELITKHHALPSAEQLAQLELKHEQWKGALEQVDDILAAGLFF